MESQLQIIACFHLADIIMQQYQRQTPCQVVWSDTMDLAPITEVKEHMQLSLNDFTLLCRSELIKNIFKTSHYEGKLHPRQRSASSNWLKCSGQAFISCFYWIMLGTKVYLKGII